MLNDMWDAGQTPLISHTDARTPGNLPILSLIVCIRLMLREEPPSAPPKNIVASGRTNQSIMVQWQPPPEPQLNGVLRGYVLRYVSMRTPTLTCHTHYPHSTFFWKSGESSGNFNNIYFFFLTENMQVQAQGPFADTRTILGCLSFS